VDYSHGHGDGRRVVAFEHERVHFLADIAVGHRAGVFFGHNDQQVQKRINPLFLPYAGTERYDHAVYILTDVPSRKRLSRGENGLGFLNGLPGTRDTSKTNNVARTSTKIPLDGGS